MSLLDSLFGGLFDDGSETTTQTVEHPCSNCPSNCEIAPDACSVCQPYKEQMIDAIYRVEHKDEIINRYEVTGETASSGTVVCPNCGGHSENPYVCEYCGSQLQEGSGKIKVASAADIPNPVLEAQDIIFDRYYAVKQFTSTEEQPEGFLSSLFGSLFGDDPDEDTTINIGNKMTEDEIEEMAEYFGVSVSDYLTGLDNGRYLTKSNKNTFVKAEEKYSSSDSGSGSSTLASLAGMMGAAGLGSLILGGSPFGSTSSSATPRPANYAKKPASSDKYRREAQKPQYTVKPQQTVKPQPTIKEQQTVKPQPSVKPKPTVQSQPKPQHKVQLDSNVIEQAKRNNSFSENPMYNKNTGSSAKKTAGNVNGARPKGSDRSARKELGGRGRSAEPGRSRGPGGGR